MLERGAADEEALLHPAERGDTAPLTCRPAVVVVRDFKDFSVSENFNHIENSSYNFEHGCGCRKKSAKNFRRKTRSGCCDRNGSFDHASPDRGRSFQDSGGDTPPHPRATPSHSQPFTQHQSTTSRNVERIFSQKNIFILSFLLVILASTTDACSSRSTPKPRPASPTMRPNITFQTYACPPAYAAWYCLNGATCFTVKIGISILYNCECADGFMGQRCEFKDLDGSYLPTRERLKMAAVQVQKAASNMPLGLIVIVALVALAAVVFTKTRTKKKLRRIQEERAQYSENGEASFHGSSSGGAETSFAESLEESSSSSSEQFWRETESPPPKARHPETPPRHSPPSPPNRVHPTTSMPKLTPSYPGEPSSQPPSSTPHPVRASFTPAAVYLPENAAAAGGRRRPFLETCRRWMAGGGRGEQPGHTRTVMNNTLSFQVENSVHKVEL